jgi:thioredoxin-related protein
VRRIGLTRRLSRFLAFTAVASICSLGTQAQEIRWYTNFDEAKADALVQNKFMILYFEQSSSDRSFKMNSGTWNQPSVIEQAEKLICVRIDYDQMRVSNDLMWKLKNEKLETRYRVDYLPLTVFIDPLGYVITRADGYIAREDMTRIMGSLPKDVSKLFADLRELDAKPDDVPLTIAAGDAYHSIGMAQLSNQYYRQLEDTDTVKSDTALADHINTFTALNLRLLGDLQKCIRLLEEGLDRYPRSENRPAQLFLLTKFYLEDTNEIRAREYVTILQKSYPGNKYSTMAEGLFKR